MKLFQSLKEIPITALPGLRIGNAQDYEAMTGVTVLLFDQEPKWAWTSAAAALPPVRRRWQAH